MKILFFSPSYRRPEKSPTQQLFPFVKLVVMDSEVEEYQKNGNEVISCPDKVQGNVSRVKNWILDNYLDQCNCLVIMDDDYSYIGRYQDQTVYRFADADLQEFSEMMTILCLDWGLKMWGINCVTDKGAYREYTPFSTNNFIGGPFHAHISGSEIRYDEDLPLKEDYDMVLQHCQKYGGALRANFCHHKVKQSEQPGGCATYRNFDKEKQQFFALQKKWGKDIIQRDKGSKRSFDYNPILKIPIRGV